MDFEEYRRCAKQIVDFIADYHKTIRYRAVFPIVKPGYMKDMLPSSAPTEGESFEDIMADVEKIILPGLVHWQSPYMHGYYPALNSPASLLGDQLANGLGTLCFSWASNPAGTELEVIVMDWLAKMIGLPDEFLHSNIETDGGGVLQSAASECLLCCVLGARTKAIMKLRSVYGYLDDAEISALLVGYASDQAHSSIEKTGLISLIKLHVIESDSDLRMRIDKLEEAIAEDRESGFHPFLVVANMGTTSACTFDDLTKIGPICETEDLWLHVDAAYAGTALICPEFRDVSKGIEYVTSFAFNPSKWMLVHVECSAMWVRNSEYLHRTFNVDPVYLRYKKSSNLAIDFMHWQIPLSRRFRALKLWFVIRNYGVSGIQEHVRRGVELAKLFEKKVRADKRFEIPSERQIGLVVFRLRDGNKKTEELLKSINDTGLLHCVPTVLKDKYVIRYVVTSTRTEPMDIERDWQLIEEHTNRISELEKVVSFTKIEEPEERKPDFGYSLTLYQEDIVTPKIINASYTSVSPKGFVDTSFLSTIGQYINRVSVSSPTLNVLRGKPPEMQRFTSLESRSTLAKTLDSSASEHKITIPDKRITVCNHCFKVLSEGQKAKPEEPLSKFLDEREELLEAEETDNTPLPRFITEETKSMKPNSKATDASRAQGSLADDNEAEKSSEPAKTSAKTPTGLRKSQKSSIGKDVASADSNKTEEPSLGAKNTQKPQEDDKEPQEPAVDKKGPQKLPTDKN